MGVVIYEAFTYGETFVPFISRHQHYSHVRYIDIGLIS